VSGVAVALAGTDPSRAGRLADQALTATERIDDPAGETQALAGIAATLTTNMADVKAYPVRDLNAIIGTEAHTSHFRGLIARLRTTDPAANPDAWWKLAQLLVIHENASGRHDLLQPVLSAAKW
jgi:hypothetical protein